PDADKRGADRARHAAGSGRRGAHREPDALERAPKRCASFALRPGCDVGAARAEQSLRFQEPWTEHRPGRPWSHPADRGGCGLSGVARDACTCWHSSRLWLGCGEIAPILPERLMTDT